MIGLRQDVKYRFCFQSNLSQSLLSKLIVIGYPTYICSVTKNRQNIEKNRTDQDDGYTNLVILIVFCREAQKN